MPKNDGWQNNDEFKVSTIHKSSVVLIGRESCSIALFMHGLKTNVKQIIWYNTCSNIQHSPAHLRRRLNQILHLMVLLLTMRNWNVSHILQRVISILVVGIVLVLIQYAAFPTSSKSSKLPRDRGIHQGVNFQHREKPLAKESVFEQDQNLPLPFPDERDFGINSKDDDKKLTGIDAESHHQSPMKNGTKMKSGRKKAKMNEKSPWDEDDDESNDAFEEEVNPQLIHDFISFKVA